MRKLVEWWWNTGIYILCVLGFIAGGYGIGYGTSNETHPTPPTPVYQKYAVAGGGFKWIVSQEFENMEEAMEWYLWLKDMENGDNAR